MLSMSERSAYMQTRARDIPVMDELDRRFRIMEPYDGYVQVLTLNLSRSRSSPDQSKAKNSEVNLVEGSI